MVEIKNTRNIGNWDYRGEEMLKNVLKIEIYKALKNRLFYVSLFIGCAIAVLAFLYDFSIYQNDLLWGMKEGANPMYGSAGLFNLWIGGEPFSLGSSVYFFVFPLLVAIPYGWSYCEEKNSGYSGSVIVSSGRKAYFLSKYCAVFLSGALAMAIPLVFSFLLSALFFPAAMPMPIYCTTNGVFYDSLMSMLYYSKPLLYVLIYLCIDFVYGGLIACISYVVSCFAKYRAITVIVPLFFLLAFHYLRQFVYISPMVRYKELSPLFFLRPVQFLYRASWLVIVVEAVVLWLVTFFITVIWERKHEIY